MVLEKKLQKSNKKSKKTDREISRGYIPDVLAEVLFPLMSSLKINSIRATLSGIHRVVPEGKWVPGGGIEIPCNYSIYLKGIKFCGYVIFAIGKKYILRIFNVAINDCKKFHGYLVLRFQ